jgi:hypothetical protein
MSRKHHTNLIYLIGRPGIGKYTIAQALAKYGYKICHNQLMNNPIFELLGYDGFSEISESAWKAIDRIRSAILHFIAQEAHNNYVLTNVLGEIPKDHKIYQQVEQAALKRGSLFVPVKLKISHEENLRRITQPMRLQRWKSINPDDISPEIELIRLVSPHLLELDVTDLSPADGAQKILNHVQSLRPQGG